MRPVGIDEQMGLMSSVGGLDIVLVRRWHVSEIMCRIPEKILIPKPVRSKGMANGEQKRPVEEIERGCMALPAATLPCLSLYNLSARARTARGGIEAAGVSLIAHQSPSKLLQRIARKA